MNMYLPFLQVNAIGLLGHMVDICLYIYFIINYQTVFQIAVPFSIPPLMNEYLYLLLLSLSYLVLSVFKAVLVGEVISL